MRPAPVKRPAAPRSISRLSSVATVKVPPRRAVTAFNGRRPWSSGPASAVLSSSTIPPTFCSVPMSALTLMSRLAFGHADWKRDGSTPCARRSAVFNGIFSNGASVTTPSPFALLDVPLIANVSSDRLPVAAAVSCAAGWPGAMCTSVSAAFASSLYGFCAPIVPSAFTRPIGVMALALCSCQRVLSPYRRTRTSSMSFLVPSRLTIVSLARRPSATAMRNGGASEAGMVSGSSSFAVVRTSTDATRSLSISIPDEKNCSGDQSMSILSAVIVLVLPLKTRRPMCMWSYSEPVTPVIAIAPPLARATRSAICCSVVSRPSSHTAPPSTTTVTPAPISVRRSQRRSFFGSGCGALSSVVVSSAIRT